MAFPLNICSSKDLKRPQLDRRDYRKILSKQVQSVFCRNHLTNIKQGHLSYFLFFMFYFLSDVCPKTIILTMKCGQGHSHSVQAPCEVSGVCNVAVWVWAQSLDYYPPTQSLTLMSPAGFPLVQCEGVAEHWLVPPDWCWGWHALPHQLAVEVHTGRLCALTISPAIFPFPLDLPKPINPNEQCFLNCGSGPNTVPFKNQNTTSCFKWF